MTVSRGMLRLSAVLVCLCLLATGGYALAQGGTTPIQIGQNVSGMLTAEARTAQFAVTAPANTTAIIQVLALTPGFAARFRLLNPAGVEILTIANPSGQATLTGNVRFNDAGVYTLVIEGENGGTGQFVLSLQPGASLPEPNLLTVDQAVTATVGSQTPVQVFRFSSTSQGTLNLTVLSQTPGSGALVTLYDESAGKTIASNDAGVVGVAYLLPADERQYRVEVRAGQSGDTAFSICAGNCGGSLSAGNTTAPSPTPQVAAPAATPELVQAGCSASSSTGGAANLRGGPGTAYAILGSLPLGQSIPVIGVWTGGGWYVVNVNGIVLWVAGSVVNLNGNCAALPAMAAPANAPLAPTRMPTVAAPTPTDTPAFEPSDTPMPMLPDLTPIALQITNPGNGTLNASVTILNNGTAAITPDQTFAILTCLDGLDDCNEVDGVSVSLQPGDTITITNPIPTFSSGGNHTVTVTLDGRSEIHELDESNNDAFASFNS